MKKKLCLLIFVLFVSLGVYAGPFGLKMGQSIEDLQTEGIDIIKLEEGIDHYIVIPPTPHREFKTYIVRIDPDEGIYFIKAIGSDIEDKGYGFNTRAKLSEIRRLLEVGYGESDLLDYIYPNSIWNENEDWMMGLFQGDILYIAAWTKDVSSILPDDINKIYLAAYATSTLDGYLTLEYYGNDYEELEQKALKSEAFIF